MRLVHEYFTRQSLGLLLVSWVHLLLVWILVCNTPTKAFPTLKRYNTDIGVGIRISARTIPGVFCTSYWHTSTARSGENDDRCFYAWIFRSSTSLSMGKGDGKKKRKKKSEGDSGPSPSPTPSSHSSQSPMRVTSDSNIPVRHQLVWAKLNKEYRKQQSNPGFRQKRVIRTSYRRSWDEEEIQEKAEQRRRKGQNPDWDVILSRSAASPLVIVDGYNIVFKWARLKKHMTKGDTARARQMLIDDVENLASLKGWRIEVVFDGGRRATGPLGHGAGEKSNKATRIDQEPKTSVSKQGVRIVFSGAGMEADSYIERRCMNAKNVTEGHLTSSFIVATDDAMIKIAAQSAGALCMSADRFINELKAAKEGMDYRVEAAVAKVNGHCVRPKQLRDFAPIQFGRNSVLIEDKRNRTKTRKEKKNEILDGEDIQIEVQENENGVPYWAQLPPRVNPYRD